MNKYSWGEFHNGFISKINNGYPEGVVNEAYFFGSVFLYEQKNEPAQQERNQYLT